MQLSELVFERMGYRKLDPGQRLEATFYRVDIYAIRGLVLEEQTACVESRDAAMRSAFLLSNSVNQAVTTILNGEHLFTEDENLWAQESKCVPSYLVVIHDSSVVHACEEGYVRDLDSGDSIQTYDSFPEAKEQLKNAATETLRRLVPALACCLGSFEHRVQLVRVATAVAGRTSNGRAVHDTRIQVRAEGYASIRRSSEEVRDQCLAAVQMASSLDSKVAHFLNLGLAESDSTKRFLYLFLAIEIHTHDLTPNTGPSFARNLA